MSIFFKIFFLTIFYIFLIYKVEAAEFWRLRYSVPYSDENEIAKNSNMSKAKLNTIGNSLSLVLANGVGIGYNKIIKNGNSESVYYKFKNHSLDLSYTFGNLLSYTFGVGSLIDGRGELYYYGQNYLTESSKGESFFFDLGIHFLLGELIFGYRQNYTEYNNFQTIISNKSVFFKDSIKLYSRQVNFGIGFLF